MTTTQKKMTEKLRPEANFEVHIVAYKGSDLSKVPKPYFLNEIALSTQGFASIATVESNSLTEAYKAFEQGSRWSEKQLKEQKTFGVHAKLEAVREQVIIQKPVLRKLPRLRTKKFHFIESSIVSAWDVHLDGFFDERLKNCLYNDQYIVLDYLSSQGKQMSTLTMHFLKPQECIAEFKRVVAVVKESGGFSGNIYWEDPLAFVVYGETIARPIVEK
jgi:hypothetical protein